MSDLRGNAIFPFDLANYNGIKVPFLAAGPCATSSASRCNSEPPVINTRHFHADESEVTVPLCIEAARHTRLLSDCWRKCVSNGRSHHQVDLAQPLPTLQTASAARRDRQRCGSSSEARPAAGRLGALAGDPALRQADRSRSTAQARQRRGSRARIRPPPARPRADHADARRRSRSSLHRSVRAAMVAPSGSFRHREDAVSGDELQVIVVRGQLYRHEGVARNSPSSATPRAARWASAAQHRLATGACESSPFSMTTRSSIPTG